MERRNCSYALHFPGKCSEQMRKPQRNSAWEARLSVLRQGLRRSFALSHTALLSGRVQWKAASCNGKLVFTTTIFTCKNQLSIARCAAVHCTIS